MKKILNLGSIKKIVLTIFFFHLLYKVGFAYFLKNQTGISEQGIHYIINNISTINDEKILAILGKVSHISSTVAHNFFTSALVTLFIFILYLILLIINNKKESQQN